MPLDTISQRDALDFLRSLPDESVQCIVTSPPYFGLRDYQVDSQIGLEETPQVYISRLVAVFHEARRVLRSDGTCFINMGDSYAREGSDSYQAGVNALVRNTIEGRTKRGSHPPNGFKHKDLMMIPARLAIALCDDGWYLRSEIVWAKPNPMPESVTDRPTKSHEMVYLLAKNATYWYDQEAIREPASSNSHGSPNVNPGWKQSAVGNNQGGYLGLWTPEMALAGRNKRSVWTVATESTSFAHFAVFPQKLIEPMIRAGCPLGGTVLDMFIGSGTTALVARRLGRHYLGCDLNAEYVEIARQRLAQPYTLPMFDRLPSVEKP